MTNDVNQILATKRAWRESERRKGDRRKKDGSVEDRKNLADCLRHARRISGYSSMDWSKGCRIANDLLFIGVCSFIVYFVVFFFSTKAHAYTEKEAVLAVIGEAEGESQRGKEAVACAIQYRGTLHGVYGLHASRVVHHKYSNMTYKQAFAAVHMASDQAYCSGLIHGATYWEGTAFKTPYWAKTMKVTAVIGHQRFYIQ